MDAVSLNYKGLVDQEQNPHLKLQRILSQMPTFIDATEPTIFKALIAIREFLKRHLVEVGKIFDGDIPQKMHQHWMKAEIAFANVDMDKNLGKDFTADLKEFLSHLKSINEEFIRPLSKLALVRKMSNFCADFSRNAYACI